MLGFYVYVCVYVSLWVSDPEYGFDLLREFLLSSQVRSVAAAIQLCTGAVPRRLRAHRVVGV